MRVFLLLILVISFSQAAKTQTFPNKLEIPYTIEGPDFDLKIRKATKRFIGNAVSETYGYNTMNYLGPTLIFNLHDTVRFTIQNTTPSDTATVHWHGFHLPAKEDGGPMSMILPGETWTPEFQVKGLASTKWYHSHMHGATATQVYKGMAGMIIVRDEAESALNLPRTYGVDDIPLIIQDKYFNQQGVLEYNFLGDTMMVNGTLSPYVECGRQIIRFRVLNASVNRVYNIGFLNNKSFAQIASDGGLLAAPVQRTRVVVAPGERVELLIDLTNEPVGTDLYLRSFSTEFAPRVVGGSCFGGTGCGTGPLDAANFNFMRIRVINPTANPVLSIPSALTTIESIPASQVSRTRIKRLLNPPTPTGHFTINGGHYDMSVINDTVIVGSTEIWRFQNNTPVAHPMHIHNVQFNVLRRNNAAPPLNERGWKDVVMVYANETVDVIATFEEFSDPEYTYMMHCHYLNHEDGGMMQQFIVIDTISDPVLSLPAASIAAEDMFHIFPNPSKDQLTISVEKGFLGGHILHGPVSVDLSVYTASGSFVMSRRAYMVNEQTSLDIAKLAPGTYIVKIISSKGEVSKTFIKK